MRSSPIAAMKAQSKIMPLHIYAARQGHVVRLTHYVSLPVNQHDNYPLIVSDFRDQ